MNRKEIIENLKAKGVIFQDENNAYIDETVTIGEGTVVEPNVRIRGNTVIGKNCVVGFGSDIVDCEIADDVNIKH